MEKINILQIISTIASIATPILIYIIKVKVWKDLKSFESSLSQYFEIHKQKIKNSELFFQKQFEASQALYKIRAEMLPAFSFPDMEWDDALSNMANDLTKTHKSLQKFNSEYYTVLKPEILEKLEFATHQAEEGALYGGDELGIGTDNAESVYKIIQECTALIKAEVDGQRLIKFQEWNKKNS